MIDAQKAKKTKKYVLDNKCRHMEVEVSTHEEHKLESGYEVSTHRAENVDT